MAATPVAKSVQGGVGIVSLDARTDTREHLRHPTCVGQARCCVITTDRRMSVPCAQEGVAHHAMAMSAPATKMNRANKHIHTANKHIHTSNKHNQISNKHYHTANKHYHMMNRVQCIGCIKQGANMHDLTMDMCNEQGANMHDQTMNRCNEQGANMYDQTMNRCNEQGANMHDQMRSIK